MNKTGEVDFFIPPPCWIFYIHSMLSNTKAALDAANIVVDSVEILGKDKKRKLDGIEQDLILNSLQTMVTHASILSKFLWPVSKNRSTQKRGEHLRKILEVVDSSPIKNNTLRNYLQHFDEKIDKYLQQNFVGIWMPSHVGPEIDTQGIPTHIFRAFYLSTGIFQVLDVRLPMQPIVDEILRIHKSLELFAESGRIPMPD